MPYFSSMDSKILWLTVSNAFFGSRNVEHLLIKFIRSMYAICHLLLKHG